MQAAGTKDTEPYALFFMGIYNTMAILIPKKRGGGYLKSPFGGHHCNNQYHEFLNLNIKYAGDCNDIDGFLEINFGLYNGDADYNNAIKEIMDGIVSIFPQCRGYHEVDKQTFWSIVDKA